MLYRTRFQLFLTMLVFAPCHLGLAQGQWIPQDINVYNPVDETLTLPQVYMLPESGDVFSSSEYIYRPVFKSRGDNLFELIATDSLQPEQECTRLEVLSAVPQLRLDMTLEEGNELIGCNAIISRQLADLETGLLVHAIWSGIDGVPNSGNVSLYNPFRSINVTGGTNGWRPVPGSGVSLTSINQSVSTSSFTFLSGNTGFLRSSFSAPFVLLSFREGVPESYSYNTMGQERLMPRLVCSDRLLDRFNQIRAGSSFDEIDSFFNCDGVRGTVTVSVNGEEMDYQWSSSAQGYFPGQEGSVLTSYRDTVRVNFLNGIAQAFQIQSSVLYTNDKECTNEDIISAANNIKVGDMIENSTDILDCGRRRETSGSDGITKSLAASWSTENPSSSLFLAENRSLSVIMEDGVVVAVNAQRF